MAPESTTKCEVRFDYRGNMAACARALAEKRRNVYVVPETESTTDTDM